MPPPSVKPAVIEATEYSLIFCPKTTHRTSLSTIVVHWSDKISENRCEFNKELTEISEFDSDFLKNVKSRRSVLK